MRHANCSPISKNSSNDNGLGKAYDLGDLISSAIDVSLLNVVPLISTTINIPIELYKQSILP
jgi:hypothetical protein